MVPFPPVIEPNLPGAYMTKHPRNINEPHGTSIPWMTGLTLDEGALKSAGKYVCIYIYIYSYKNTQKSTNTNHFELFMNYTPNVIDFYIILW